MLESGSVLEQMTCPGNRFGSRAEIISELCAFMDYRLSSGCRSTPYGMMNKLAAINRQHPNTLQTIHFIMTHYTYVPKKQKKTGKSRELISCAMGRS